MVKKTTQLEMFSIEEEKEKKGKSPRIEGNFIISKSVLIYIILGILVLLVIVYISGVEVGRNWKVDKIYREYIKGEK